MTQETKRRRNGWTKFKKEPEPKNDKNYVLRCQYLTGEGKSFYKDRCSNVAILNGPLCQFHSSAKDARQKLTPVEKTKLFPKCQVCHNKVCDVDFTIYVCNSCLGNY